MLSVRAFLTRVLEGKFTIDLDHRLPWSVVQEVGYVLNYLSLDEQLPILLMTVPPPPYMHGGPRDYLSWVIESRDKNLTADVYTPCREGLLPPRISVGAIGCANGVGRDCDFSWSP